LDTLEMLLSYLIADRDVSSILAVVFHFSTVVLWIGRLGTFYDFLKRALKPAQRKPGNPCEVFMAETSPWGRNPTCWQFLHRLGGKSCQVSYLASSGIGRLYYRQ